jgi:hypothetical protein
MTANPMTDQILAAVAETHGGNPPPPWVLELFADLAEAVAESLPELDPHDIGKVLMHAGSGFASLGDQMDPRYGPSTNFGATVLIGTGERLYRTGRPDTSST